MANVAYFTVLPPEAILTSNAVAVVGQIYFILTKNELSFVNFHLPNIDSKSDEIKQN
jgi:hypothetical protein